MFRGRRVTLLEVEGELTMDSLPEFSRNRSHEHRGQFCTIDIAEEHLPLRAVKEIALSQSASAQIKRTRPTSVELQWNPLRLFGRSDGVALTTNDGSGGTNGAQTAAATSFGGSGCATGPSGAMAATTIGDSGGSSTHSKAQALVRNTIGAVPTLTCWGSGGSPTAHSCERAPALSTGVSSHCTTARSGRKGVEGKAATRLLSHCNQTVETGAEFTVGEKPTSRAFGSRRFRRDHRTRICTGNRVTGSMEQTKAFFLALSLHGNKQTTYGSLCGNDTVAKLFSKAAVAIGAPPEAAPVASLRSGGESALWDADAPAEEIKLRERGSSDGGQDGRVEPITGGTIGNVSSPGEVEEEAGSGEGTDGTDPPSDWVDDPRSRRLSLQRSKHVYVYAFILAIGCGL